MAANNEDFEDDVEQNEQELEQNDEDKRKRYFSKERMFDLDNCYGHDHHSTKLRRIFSHQSHSITWIVRCMMYGFGDDQNPYTESVDLLEDLVIQYISEITYKAMEVGKQGRVTVEDILFLTRKDNRKFTRVKELLLMNEELKKARKAFDEVKYGF